MNVKSAAREGSKVTVIVEVDSAKFEEGLSKAFQKNKKYISIPGFRKGKAPRKMVEAMYGAQVFYEDAVNEIFPDVYQEAVLDRISVLERRLEEGLASGGLSQNAGGGQTAGIGQAAGSGRKAGQKAAGNSGTKPAESGFGQAAAGPGSPEQTPVLSVRPEAIPEEIRDAVGRWHQLTASLPGVLRVYARKARLSLSDDNKLVLVFDDKMAYTYVSDERMTETLKQVLAKQTGREIPLRIVLQEQAVPFERNHIDLTKIIHNIDIEIEE